MDKDRRRRFIAYFLGKPLEGDRSKLILKTGLSKGRVAQLFDVDQAFGERAARSLADRLGLVADYFEHDRSEEEQPPVLRFSDKTIQFAVMFEHADPGKRAVLEALIFAAGIGTAPIAPLSNSDMGGGTHFGANDDNRPFNFGTAPGESLFGGLDELPVPKTKKKGNE